MAAASSTTPLVTLSHVDVQMWTGGVPTSVLHDVSLVVQPGDRVLVAGPRASGKTILLRTIAGIVSPARGERIVHAPCLPLLGGGVTYDATLSIRDNLLWHLTSWGFNWKPDFSDLVHEIATASGILPSYGTRPENLGSREQIRLLAMAALFIKPRIFLIDNVDERVDPHFGEWISDQLTTRLEASTILIAAGDWAESHPHFLTRRIRISKGRIERDESLSVTNG